jgi:hypothetical protein
VTKLATIGDNNPPVDPIDEALAPYAAYIDEATLWLDGTPVETEGQMHAVDIILKQIRNAGTDLGKAKKSATAPFHDKWKGEIARWKPTEDDIDRMKKGLAALVDPFKRKLADEKEAIKRAAYKEAQRLEDEARKAAATANPANIEEQREAAEGAQAAQDAMAAAATANKDTVKGLRTVHKYKVANHRKALSWIAQNDRDAVTSFIELYVEKNHRAQIIEGVRTWQQKEAF